MSFSFTANGTLILHRAQVWVINITYRTITFYVSIAEHGLSTEYYKELTFLTDCGIALDLLCP